MRLKYNVYIKYLYLCGRRLQVVMWLVCVSTASLLGLEEKIVQVSRSPHYVCHVTQYSIERLQDDFTVEGVIM